MADALVATGVVVAVVVVAWGLWRATAAQKGTGCPCCDKVLGADHGEHEHGCHAAERPSAPAPQSKA